MGWRHTVVRDDYGDAVIRRVDVRARVPYGANEILTLLTLCISHKPRKGLASLASLGGMACGG